MEDEYPSTNLYDGPSDEELKKIEDELSEHLD